MISKHLYFGFYHSGKTFNNAVIWISMTFGLIGTIVCLTVFVLSRYTNIDVIEEEKAFTKSPQLISTLGTIKMVGQVTSKLNNGTEKKLKENSPDVNDDSVVPSMGTVLLVEEIVSKAASAANKGHSLQQF